MTPHKLCAYWQPRKESVHACADRLGRFLIALSACDPVFTFWYERGSSRRKGKQFEVDFKSEAHLLDLLERGRNRRDVGKEVMEDLGFRIGLWNGGKTVKMAGLSVNCGLYATVAGLGGNCLILDLPEDLGDLQRSERMADVLATVATSWEPDWAGVFSVDAMNTRGYNPVVPFVDWMVYVSLKLAPLPLAVASAKAIDGMGTLVVVDRGPEVGETAGHLERVRAVEAGLGLRS